MNKTAEEILMAHCPDWEYPSYQNKGDILSAMEEYRSLPSGVTEQQLEEMARNFIDATLGKGVYGHLTHRIESAFIAGYKASCPVSEWVKVEDKAEKAWAAKQRKLKNRVIKTIGR